MRFKELSYANERDPRLKRWFIRSIEGLSGRDRYARLYDIWRKDIVGKTDRVFGKMLDLIDVELDVQGEWLPVVEHGRPLVIVANHPFGIGDGIAVLAMAEQLGRPFRVLINDELLKVPEMAPYSLPVSFEETKEALAINMQTRHEALKLLKEGVTIIIFPAGGVATAKKGFGMAQDLPWKIFAAKLVLPHCEQAVADAQAVIADPRVQAAFRQFDPGAGWADDDLGRTIWHQGAEGPVDCAP